MVTSSLGLGVNRHAGEELHHAPQGPVHRSANPVGYDIPDDDHTSLARFGGTPVSGRIHVRCAVDVDPAGCPTRVQVAGYTWSVEGASLLPARRLWGLNRPARWQVSCANVTLELYAQEYRPGAAGLTWWWVVIPDAALAPLKLQRSLGGRGLRPLEPR